MSDSTVVVIGGGLVGLAAIRELGKRVPNASVTLVEPKEYVEVSYAALRGIVDPAGIGRAMRSTWRELTDARHIAARAREIEGNEVVLETGERVHFAHAIVATGSITAGVPFIKGGGADTISAREGEFATENERLAAAKSVLIVGGGPIGVELTGEIVSTYPEKSVTLVHSTDRLLPALHRKAGEKAARVLRGRGVDIVPGTKVEEHNGEFLAPDGRRFTADVVYRAVGVKTTSIPVDGAESLNDRNQLRVDPELRVLGRSNVFAVGDVNDVAEIKLGATGNAQAKVAVTNVAALLLNGDARLKRYKPAPPLGLVTLGRRAGIAQLPFVRVDFLIGAKQKDMLIARTLGGQ